MMKKTKLLFLSILLMSQFKAEANQDINCLAKNIYHEARSESYNAKVAVGLITINRGLARFKNSPHPICSAVYEKKQFSWTRHRNVKIKEIGLFKEIVTLSERLYNSYFLLNIIPPALSKLRNIYYYAEKGYRPIKKGIRVAIIDSFHFWKTV